MRGACASSAANGVQPECWVVLHLQLEHNRACLGSFLPNPSIWAAPSAACPAPEHISAQQAEGVHSPAVTIFIHSPQWRLNKLIKEEKTISLAVEKFPWCLGCGPALTAVRLRRVLPPGAGSLSPPHLASSPSKRVSACHRLPSDSAKPFPPGQPAQASASS